MSMRGSTRHRPAGSLATTDTVDVALSSVEPWRERGGRTGGRSRRQPGQGEPVDDRRAEPRVGECVGPAREGLVRCDERRAWPTNRLEFGLRVARPPSAARMAVAKPDRTG